MTRCYYEAPISLFLQQDDASIFGEISKNHSFSLEETQKRAWIEEIKILKKELCELKDGYISFEYSIPRVGKRLDVILILNNIIFLIEFKVGDKFYHRHAIEQVIDYALDLQNFHKESHHRLLVPFLISTEAFSQKNEISFLKKNLLNVMCCHDKNIKEQIDLVCKTFSQPFLDPTSWINSPYQPTPTIIEAAQNLYQNHSVKDISRNDASAINLTKTTTAINQIIETSKEQNKKSICFITGVPGAGKTLAGLNIAIERQKIDKKEHAVFLSGNAPLVAVLQEALARDDVKNNKISKTEAKRKTGEFIQIIHHFRDDAIALKEPPIEKVAVFDEAQRAWTKEELCSFMKRKKGIPHFNQSEPDFLISVMNRHSGWATIICLIGGGQEINHGEAGLTEWFQALEKNYPDWNIYISDKIIDSEYSAHIDLSSFFLQKNVQVVPELHLSVSLRSFRSENVSSFVKALLDVDMQKASVLYRQVKDLYPIVMTRDINQAKKWVKEHAKGTERYGLLASSGAKRLKKYAIWMQSKINATEWFLNDKDDTRSSFYLEDSASEFDVQGLELDWSIVCWDANFRFANSAFKPYQFKGTKWMNIHKTEDILYLKNAYRVLLTRARQGMVIFVPPGDHSDLTCPPDFYQGIYEYFKQIGIEEI